MAGTGSSRAPQITRIWPAGKRLIRAVTCSRHRIAHRPTGLGHLRAQHVEHRILLLNQASDLHLRRSDRIARRK